jgi:hypothetical protein
VRAFAGALRDREEVLLNFVEQFGAVTVGQITESLAHLCQVEQRSLAQRRCVVHALPPIRS